MQCFFEGSSCSGACSPASCAEQNLNVQVRDNANAPPPSEPSLPEMPWSTSCRNFIQHGLRIAAVVYMGLPLGMTTGVVHVIFGRLHCVGICAVFVACVFVLVVLFVVVYVPPCPSVRVCSYTPRVRPEPIRGRGVGRGRRRSRSQVAGRGRRHHWKDLVWGRRILRCGRTPWPPHLDSRHGYILDALLFGCVVVGVRLCI